MRCREIRHIGLVSCEIYIAVNRTVCNIILVAKMRYSRTGINMIPSKKDAIFACQEIRLNVINMS